LWDFLSPTCTFLHYTADENLQKKFRRCFVVKIASIKFHFENSFLEASELSKEEKSGNNQEESTVIPFHLMDKDGKICIGEIVEINDNNEFKPVLHVDKECESNLEDEDFSYILKEFEAQKKNQKPKKQAVDNQKSNTKTSIGK